MIRYRPKSTISATAAKQANAAARSRPSGRCPWSAPAESAARPNEKMPTTAAATATVTPATTSSDIQSIVISFPFPRFDRQTSAGSTGAAGAIVTSGLSLTLSADTAFLREMAQMVQAAAIRAVATTMTPTVPVLATAADTAPTVAAAGRVSSQPYSILRAVVQRTSASFLPKPVPMTEPAHTWVVDSPKP